MKNFFFLAFLFLGINFSFSQTKIDSLEQQLLTLNDDTNKLQVYEDLRRLYSMQDLNKSLEYAKKLLNLAIDINAQDWIADSYYIVGATQIALNDYENAKESLNSAETSYNRANDYLGRQKVLYNLASIQRRIGDLDTALSYYQKIISWDSLASDHSFTPKAYNSMGSVYNSQNEFDKARDAYLNGMRIAKKYGVTSTEAYSNYNIGTMYIRRDEHLNGKEFLLKAIELFDSIGYKRSVAEVNFYLAVIESEIKNLDVAEEKLRESLLYFTKLNDKRMIIECLQHLGINAKYQKDYSKAEKEFMQSILVCDETGLLDRKVAMQLNLADVYYNAKRYKSALEIIDKALQANKSDRNLLSLEKDLIEIRFKVEEAQGNSVKALKTYKFLNLLEDSLNKKTDDERFSQLEVEYEVEKKESEIANQKLLLEKEKLLVKEEKRYNNILYTAVAILIILVILIIISFLGKQRANRLLQDKNKLIQEQTTKLKALDTTKTKFFNNVAHELRTPLTLMSGHMESMLRNRFGGLNENQRKSILVAKRNSSRLMDLVSEILDLGKLEAGKMEMQEKPVLLKPFLDRIFFTFESLAFQFELKLSFDYQLDNDLTLLLDESKIEKALNNVIHNAIKFTTRGGEIKLKVSQENEWFQIVVTDTGKGISESEQGKIFERYFQTEEKDATAQGGTGIGLTLVKEFVELHGGKVVVSSIINTGSEFTLKFPQSRKTEPVSFIENEHTELESLPVYPVLEKKDKTILVVDDHKEMQQFLKGIIGNYAKVIIANDGVEALRKLEKNKIDLITIDLMMPNMDGSTLMKRIKENPEYAQLPTIMLTARSTVEDKVDMLQIGVSDYITKPFKQLELIARIANLLENKQVRDESNSESGETPETKESTANDFIDRLRMLVNKNLNNSYLTVSVLAQEMGYSDKQLTRNVKKATGLTPLKFIREIKLLYALEQLRANNFETVAELSYAIGIDNPSHFSKLFKERFGKNPSEYLT